MGRDFETIDSELRLLAAVRWSIREHGGEPSSRQVDETARRAPNALRPWEPDRVSPRLND
jgi:hypothetical protein